MPLRLPDISMTRARASLRQDRISRRADAKSRMGWRAGPGAWQFKSSKQVRAARLLKWATSRIVKVSWRERRLTVVPPETRKSTYDIANTQSGSIAVSCARDSSSNPTRSTERRYHTGVQFVAIPEFQGIECTSAIDCFAPFRPASVDQALEKHSKRQNDDEAAEYK